MNKLLNFGLDFSDFDNYQGIQNLDKLFLSYLKFHDVELYSHLVKNRQQKPIWNKEIAAIVINIAGYLDSFLGEVFRISRELEELKSKNSDYGKVYLCKRNFVQRIALKSPLIPANNLDRLKILISDKLDYYSIEFFEQIFAEFTEQWIKNNDQDKLEQAIIYTKWACLSKDGQQKHKKGILFKIPKKFVDGLKFFVEEYDFKGAKAFKIADDLIMHRAGFSLTDHGLCENFIADQSNYCIHCHAQSRDSCSHGYNENLTGCPLDEKISEMNLLKTRGNIIGAIAIAVIDNPMLAATGHRICNDCMKACIYQKQQPVDIPQIETGILTELLNLPWGFEIYFLLTKWNPLNYLSPFLLEDSGAKVMVVGMGPAGFTMAHYLLNLGHVVVGVDGLKIEQLDPSLLKPIKNIAPLFSDLATKIVSGFGGVMEYGITNRWNKNFLTLIRIMLERRANFKLISGVRFGSNITFAQAFAMGFQHIALALGAGSPKLINLPDIMVPGVKTASDFLMSLQLGKAYLADSLTNLQIRLPIIVIGGGLTALDSATEALAYYPELVKNFSQKKLPKNLSMQEQEIANEYLRHAELFKNSKNLLETIKELGGVKILYRQPLSSAPSYRLNHEELAHGLAEGIEFIEQVTPKRIILDEYGAVQAIEVLNNITNSSIIIPASTILIAAGTKPNIILAQEYPEILSLSNGFFKEVMPFIVYQQANNSVSHLGDLHPGYAGNVVNAMASSKNAYPVINQMLEQDYSYNKQIFFQEIEEKLTARLIAINRLTPSIIEMVFISPQAAINFKPGQFFKLQNFYQTDLPLIEPIALTGAKVNPVTGEISCILLEMGESSKLCQQFKIGEKVILMGPTGEATEIGVNEKILLIGGGLGNAVLFSIGQKMRKQNNHVTYFAGYKKSIDRYKVEEIEEAADQIIWACDEELLQVTRSQDLSIKGSILDAIEQYLKADANIIQTIDRIVIIGSDLMMNAVKIFYLTKLKRKMKFEHKVIASINSPMQCMMKEICGQCLQKHIDPVSGQESYVFSCNKQDQDVNLVDFSNLTGRLKANSLLEKCIRHT